jgi:hypothetical protein
VLSSIPIERRERDEERFEDEALLERLARFEDRPPPLREPMRLPDIELTLERPRERLPPLLDEPRLPPLRRERRPELRLDRLLDERSLDLDFPPDLLLPPTRCAMCSPSSFSSSSRRSMCDIAPTRLRVLGRCKRCATVASLRAPDLTAACAAACRGRSGFAIDPHQPAPGAFLLQGHIARGGIPCGT